MYIVYLKLKTDSLGRWIGAVLCVQRVELRSESSDFPDVAIFGDEHHADDQERHINNPSDNLQLVLGRKIIP